MQNLYDQQDLKIVKDILCRLLNVESIGDDQDYYQAGLTSIMVLPFLSELEDSFKLIIPDSDFLDARTPRALAHLIPNIRKK